MHKLTSQVPVVSNTADLQTKSVKQHSILLQMLEGQTTRNQVIQYLFSNLQYTITRQCIKITILPLPSTLYIVMYSSCTCATDSVSSISSFEGNLMVYSLVATLVRFLSFKLTCSF